MTEAYTMVHSPKLQRQSVAGSSNSPLKLLGSPRHGKSQQNGNGGHGQGRVQGNGNGSKANGIPSKGVNGIQHNASKKRKVVMMDSSDDEDIPRQTNGVNGVENGQRNRKKARMSVSPAGGKKGAALLEQRKALPIWTGL